MGGWWGSFVFNRVLALYDPWRDLWHRIRFGKSRGVGGIMVPPEFAESLIRTYREYGLPETRTRRQSGPP